MILKCPAQQGGVSFSTTGHKLVLSSVEPRVTPRPFPKSLATSPSLPQCLAPVSDPSPFPQVAGNETQPADAYRHDEEPLPPLDALPSIASLL